MGKGSHEREDTLRPPTFEIMVAPLLLTRYCTTAEKAKRGK